LELKREKENKEKERVGVVKDGYKIVDGVEKKRSTSGVYTRKSASSMWSKALHRKLMWIVLLDAPCSGNFSGSDRQEIQDPIDDLSKRSPYA
jgi:hypothetical protein